MSEPRMVMASLILVMEEQDTTMVITKNKHYPRLGRRRLAHSGRSAASAVAALHFLRLPL
jgi:hypothetical protein